MQAVRQSPLPFSDHHQQVGTHRCPHLAAYGVISAAQEHGEFEMLLNPFKEQLHLPALAVEQADGRSRQPEFVCKQNKVLVMLWAINPDTA